MTLNTTTNSYSIVIRDSILACIRDQTYFEGFAKFGRSRALQVQPQNIPYVGAYIVDEIMSPDGDINAGDIRFVHATRMGLSVIIMNNDPDATEDKLDEAYWAIMNGVLTNNDITNMLSTPSGARIEGFSRCTRKHNYRSLGDNEQPIAELQVEMTFNYRSRWWPVIEDDLDTIHVTTGFPIAGTTEDRAKVKQVVVEYDLTSE